MKKALITGVLGQDGSYLTELLIASGYEVYGIDKLPLNPHSVLIQKHLQQKGINFTLHTCDLDSIEDVKRIMILIQPDECYHFATIHFSSEIHINKKLEIEQQLIKSNINMCMNLCYAIMECSPQTRLVFAGSCFMYEDGKASPQNENTPFLSYAPYGISKITCSSIIEHLRSSYNMHFSTAILFNHESPRRTLSFVTKKIVNNLVRIKRKEINEFTLGNLNAIKDWGYAKDYVYGMWLMSRQATPGDYVLATGCPHTIEDFLGIASGIVGVDWHNHVILEPGVVEKKVRCRLIGDWSLAKKVLGWEHSVSFEGLIELMVKNELSGNLD